MQSGTVPYNKRIYQDLLSAVQTGELSPGDSLPTERELQARYGVSRVPVRQALAKLETEGHIRRTPGRGTEVLRPPLSTYKLSGFSHWYNALGDAVTSRTIAYQTVPADEEVAHHLGLVPGAPVLRIRRIRMVEGEPSAYMNNFFAVRDLAAALPCLEDDRYSLTQFIRAMLGRDEAEVQEDLEAVAAPEEAAAMLKVPVGSPLLFVTRRGWDEEGKPVELSRYWARTNKATYRTFRSVQYRGG